MASSSPSSSTGCTRMATFTLVRSPFTTSFIQIFVWICNIGWRTGLSGHTVHVYCLHSSFSNYLALFIYSLIYRLILNYEKLRMFTYYVCACVFIAIFIFILVWKNHHRKANCNTMTNAHNLKMPFDYPNKCFSLNRLLLIFCTVREGHVQRCLLHQPRHVYSVFWHSFFVTLCSAHSVVHIHIKYMTDYIVYPVYSG